MPKRVDAPGIPIVISAEADDGRRIAGGRRRGGRDESYRFITEADEQRTLRVIHRGADEIVVVGRGGGGIDVGGILKVAFKTGQLRRGVPQAVIGPLVEAGQGVRRARAVGAASQIAGVAHLVFEQIDLPADQFHRRIEAADAQRAELALQAHEGVAAGEHAVVGGGGGVGAQLRFDLINAGDVAADLNVAFNPEPA